MMCLVLRELQVGVEALLLTTSLALVGESLPTTLSPRAALVAGGILQQQGPPPVYPRMGVNPGERRSHPGGMILATSQHPKAGESNPKQPTAGAIVEGAIMPGIGGNQRRAKRVPPTRAGRGKQEAGRKTQEVGGCLLQHLGYLQLEEMGAGESQFASAPLALLKVGEASLKRGPLLKVGEASLKRGPLLKVGEASLKRGPLLKVGEASLKRGPLLKVGEASLKRGPVVVVVVVGEGTWALGLAQAQQSRVEAGGAVRRSP